MTVVDRFLQYVKFDTQSDEETNMTPSTPGQMIFAQHLENELRTMGLKDISLDENGYLMATLPGNIDKEVPTVGFIAHLDTSPDMSGRHVTPRIVQSYDGGDITLNPTENIVLSPRQFPELLDYKGEDLIVTDGNTLLGADDKAGIADDYSIYEFRMPPSPLETWIELLTSTAVEAAGLDMSDMTRAGMVRDMIVENPFLATDRGIQTLMPLNIKLMNLR